MGCCHPLHPLWTCSHGEQTHLSPTAFTLSPSATWQMTSPVAGLMVGKVFLLTASCHSLFMKICKEKAKQGEPSSQIPGESG